MRRKVKCKHQWVADGPYVSCALCGGGRECRGWKAACKRLLRPLPQRLDDSDDDSPDGKDDQGRP